MGTCHFSLCADLKEHTHRYMSPTQAYYKLSDPRPTLCHTHY